MNDVFRILKLTEAFYKKYPHNEYPEILNKMDRPYHVLICKINSKFYICSPFRTEINHRESFIFRNTHRSINHQSGIDV